MKIKILRGTRASGRSLLVGEVCAVGKDVTEKEAALLIGMKKAEEVKSKKAASKDAGGDDQHGVGGA